MGVGPKVYIRTYSYCYDLLLTVVVSILMTTFYTRDLDDDGQDLTATNILRSINLCICFRVIRVVMQVRNYFLRIRNIIILNFKWYCHWFKVNCNCVQVIVAMFILYRR